MEPQKYSICLENVSKVYRIPKHGRESVVGSLTVIMDALLGKYGRKHSMFRHFEALQAIDLKVGVGESLAIVGRNGSGKSTLLEIIAGTLKATTGKIVVDGRVSALLQLGSGFNQDFTGLENVFLNGSMMGLSRYRIEEKLDEILAFADIGDFVHQPVRTYSTGMRLRLAFAVITAVDPEILIIDEALSVGDAFFQSRCVRWLEAYLEKKRTFLCVSHDMFMIRRLCQRGIVLDEGKMVCDADVSDAANLYYRLHRKKPVIRRDINARQNTENRKDEEAFSEDEPQSDRNQWKPLALDFKERTGDGSVTIESVKTCPELTAGLNTGDRVEVEIEILAHEDVAGFNFGFGFRDRSGLLIGGVHSMYQGERIPALKENERRVIKFEAKLDLKPQQYLLVIGLSVNYTAKSWHDLDCVWDCAKFDITGTEPFWGLTPIPTRKCEVISKKGD